MIGSLFIRTYERGERVYQAMQARGYQGVPLVEKVPSGGRLDIMALTITSIWIVLGQAVYLRLGL
jgi:cobalt/nickel transport system permease protein